MRLLSTLALTTLLIFACNSDDDEQSSTIQVNDLSIVTGMLLRDQNGQPIAEVGTPNDYNELYLYPNPPDDLQTAILPSGEVSSVYILPAEKNTDYTEAEVNSVYDNFEGYSEEELENNSVRSTAASTANQQIQYRTDGLAPGYYRVIVTSTTNVQYGASIFVDSTLFFPTEVGLFIMSEWE